MTPTTRSQTKSQATESTRRLSSRSDPPTYCIDLSAPPEERYREICSDFKPYLADIVPIYDDLLRLMPAPRVLNFLAKSLLRRVHSKEETREIRGISKLTGVPLHLVLAYNTFLDLFSGCSSGGARVCDAGNGHQSGIVHFRGLDWEMEPLRKLIINCDYVRDGQVVARAVTYAGYTGVLTGVRYGLSISLNYRNLLGSPSSVLSLRLHQVALLLGLRPSIPSILRDILLSPSPPASPAAIAYTLPSRPSTPCYLTFCSPEAVIVLEKDLVTAVVHTSIDFLAVTNHDVHMEELTPDDFRARLKQEGMGDDAIVDDSIERKECVSQMWVQKGAGLKVADIAQQMEVQPVLNECTHFSCIMDPAVAGGGLLWVHAHEESVGLDYSGVVSELESD
ncbi:beta subunit of N-acylethanolamine-hydrolyzing acid amidase-domain-containing protein [Mycena maculata]|uniref:ceramidase n=1 Tax=Mycena maculata TaxID=230809 RepID=A0AAD7N5H2_9AGAR|nr:beta subunit of N-acylethanolamine-hydrolyzing acid amidase-domain-containing protein [Mycena maculata]